MARTAPPPAARRRLGLATLGIALAGSLGLGAASAGEAVRVRGTSVRLEPPPDFQVAERFPGFAHEASQSSIQVSVVPGPLAQTRKGMTKEGLAQRGMALVSQEAATVNEQSATLLHVRQEANGVEFEKWLVLAGDDRTTVLLVATTPAPAAEPLRAALRTALLGARWDPAAPTDLFDGLPFRLTPSGTLTDAKRTGDNVLLTEPDPPVQGVERAVYVAGVSLNPVEIPSLAAFARHRAAATASVKALGNVRGTAIEVAGLEAYELVADGKDTASSAPVLVYQVVIRDGKGYWLVQGVVAADRAAECLPLFRRITASIARP